jgi:Cu2+-exporting ATPase
LLALSGSTWSYFATNGSASYFDTVSVFTALMLVGRFLQERVVEKNRKALLENDGVEALVARRVESDAVHVVRCVSIRPADALLVAPGDLVCVDAVLEDARAEISLDWINGESAARRVERGATVPAGAFNVGKSAVRVRATTGFDRSPLVDLLRTTASRDADLARATPWWRRFAGAYVAAVLSAAVLAFAVWAFAAGVPRGLEVATAVLVVTCPCAFGIATPMAYELVQAGLRRGGLFVRSPAFLDRAQAVRRVVFDKTGTLTTTRLAAAEADALLALDPSERRALYNLVARSAHPKSAAIRGALEATSDDELLFDPSLVVVEEPGEGLTLAGPGRSFELDRRGFVVDGAVRLALRVDEELRHDARAEIEALTDAGYEVWILSGDEQHRVNDMADRLGVPRGRAIGSATPERKEAFIAGHDAGDTLMIGDGINDGPAVERATCSGTPAIDRPFMPARSDFYFTTPGLRPIGLALRAARALARVTRRNLAVAVVYNVGTVALAYAGLMSPLLCAIAMPASSLSIVALTTWSLSPRSALWKS